MKDKATANKPKSGDAVIEEICRGTDRLAVVIMPRNLGRNHPDTPHSHHPLWSRADIIAEWENGEFHIVKRKET